MNYFLAYNLLLLSLILTSGKGISQNIDSVQFHKGFKFNRGLYLSVDQFRKNTPIPISKIVYNGAASDSVDFKSVIGEKYITYINSKGDTLKDKTTHFWGYSNGDSVYYFTSNNNKLVLFGQRVYRPVAPASLYEIGEVCLFRVVRSYVNSNQTVLPVTVDYMIDLNSGNSVSVTNYTTDSLLQKDPELYKEYKLDAATKREKNVLYLMKYNVRHPLYFRKESVE